MRFLGVLLLSLWLTSSAHAFTHKQGKSASGSINGSNQFAITLTSALTAGSVLVGGIRAPPNGISITSISDGTNTYTIKDNFADTTDSTNIFSFILGNISGGPTTITITFGSGSGNGVDAVVDEYSGASAVADPSDGHNVQFQNNPGTGANAIKSPTIATTVSGDLIWGATFSSSNTPAPAAGTSPLTFTLEETATTTGLGSLASEDGVQSASGNVNTAFTDSTNGGGSNFDTIIIAIKPAAGAATCPSLALMGVGC